MSSTTTTAAATTDVPRPRLTATFATTGDLTVSRLDVTSQWCGRFHVPSFASSLELYLSVAGYYVVHGGRVFGGAIDNVNAWPQLGNRSDRADSSTTGIVAAVAVFGGAVG
jgi:hypothetical protein